MLTKFNACFFSISFPAVLRILLVAVGRDRNADCISKCPGAPVTWCVHMYHPVETISLCYNDSGHVINITDAADRLKLQDKYEIRPQVRLVLSVYLYEVHTHAYAHNCAVGGHCVRGFKC